jgi:hypothetical protein
VYIPAARVGLRGGRELHLDTIDTVDAIDEENEDEDERDLCSSCELSQLVSELNSYLHAILQFRYNRALRDESE